MEGEGKIETCKMTGQKCPDLIGSKVAYLYTLLWSKDFVSFLFLVPSPTLLLLFNSTKRYSMFFNFMLSQRVSESFLLSKWEILILTTHVSKMKNKAADQAHHLINNLPYAIKTIFCRSKFRSTKWNEHIPSVKKKKKGFFFLQRNVFKKRCLN